jgi:hypothetical protein
MRVAVMVTAAVAVAGLGIAFAIAVAWGAFRAPAMGAGAAVDEARSFTPAEADRVTVDAVSERVVVGQSTDGRVNLRLRGNIAGIRQDAAPRLSAETRAGALEVRVLHWPHAGLAILPANLVLEISLPRGLQGSLSVRTVSGEVELAEGSFRELAVTTKSGEVRLAPVSAESVSIRTTSGEIFLRCASRPGSAEIHSTSGDVTMTLPEGAGLRLSARSTSGGTRCDLPITVSAGGEHRLEGTVGDGSGRASIETVSGDIRVTR